MSEEIALTPEGAAAVAYIYMAFKDGQTVEEIGEDMDLTVEEIGILFALGEASGFVDEFAKEVDGSN